MQNNFRCVLLAFLWLFSSQDSLAAGVLKYPVSAIPPDLLKNADMVVRISETILEIGSLTRATEKVHLVFTVFRESALEKASLRIFYDNDSKITSFRGMIYDAHGLEVTRFRESDLIDRSAVPSGTLYSDDRVKYIRPVSSKYPFTIEYEFERSSRQMMQYPQWRGIDDYHTAVESASLIIYSDLQERPRTMTLCFPGKGEWPVRNSDSSMYWYIQNIPAMVPEPLCTDIGELVPRVYIAPAMVNIPGQDPEPASWKSYGMWINRLNRNRGDLPDLVKDKVHQLTDAMPDPRDKMKVIYRYLQENTRYISVKIGIGGYQPADALSVARNGYGDCKALANYMKALLDCAGIRSHYTLVMAGKQARPLRTNFPGLQFNHVILCVPMINDTVWLECTSQTIPFGFLGGFTDDRDVLVVTPEGGVLVHTPVYPKELNRMNRSGRIEIDSTGYARMAVTTRVSGLQYELFDSRLSDSQEDQKKKVREEIGLSLMSITRLEYLEKPGLLPEITETLEINLPAFATISGNRIFIPLNTFNRQPSLPPIEEARKLPFYPGYGFMDADSILLKIPPGFTIDFLPESVNLSSPFGSFSSKVTGSNTEILYVRHFTREGIEFPPGDYESYHAFIRQISKADKTKALILQTTH